MTRSVNQANAFLNYLLKNTTGVGGLADLNIGHATNGVYIALSDTNAPNSTTGAFTELTGGGYTRKQLTAAQITVGSGNASNNAEITWTAVGAQIGPFRYVVTMAASTGGTNGDDVIVWGDLGTNQTIPMDVQARFNTGALKMWEVPPS